MFRLLPARLLSRRAGSLSERELPLWLRGPLLGLYVRVCGCDMSEAVEEEVTKYRSLSALFTRSLKPDVRPISREHSLVCTSLHGEPVGVFAPKLFVLISLSTSL